MPLLCIDIGNTHTHYGVVANGQALFQRALLDAVLTELARRGEPLPKVLATGGAAALLEKTLRHPFTLVPDLTLRGLAAAWRLNAPPG